MTVKGIVTSLGMWILSMPEINSLTVVVLTAYAAIATLGRIRQKNPVVNSTRKFNIPVRCGKT